MFLWYNLRLSLPSSVAIINLENLYTIGFGSKHERGIKFKVTKIRVYKRWCLLIQLYFCNGYDYGKKVDLSKIIGDQKEKCG